MYTEISHIIMNICTSKNVFAFMFEVLASSSNLALGSVNLGVR